MLRLKGCDWLHSFPSTCRIDVLGMDIGKGYWKIYLHVSWKHFDTKCFSHVKSFLPFWINSEQYRERAPGYNFEHYTKGNAVLHQPRSSLLLENSWETWKLMVGCFYGIGKSIWVKVSLVPKQGVNLENEPVWLIEQHCHQMQSIHMPLGHTSHYLDLPRVSDAYCVSIYILQHPGKSLGWAITPFQIFRDEAYPAYLLIL